jgi:hypothetical protein
VLQIHRIADSDLHTRVDSSRERVGLPIHLTRRAKRATVSRSLQLGFRDEEPAEIDDKSGNHHKDYQTQSGDNRKYAALPGER